MQDDKQTPELPPVEAAGYLVGHLWEVGPTMATGSGSGPITFQELHAWQEQIGVELQPWEIRILRQLSLDYLVEFRKAEDPLCPPPYGKLSRNPNLDKKLDEFLD